jgi:hypothetical protein
MENQLSHRQGGYTINQTHGTANKQSLNGSVSNRLI